jgi:hypothetical protein
MEDAATRIQYLKFGFYSSLSLSILTIVTFGFAMIAVPPAGPYCPDNCMDYPFRDLLLYYPRDYYWMYLAIIQLFVFVIFMVTHHFIASARNKLYTFLSISFALISSTILLQAYFTQFSVVPASVVKGEAEGIALITQYNDHGLFIAMEELGYITMSVALFFLAFAFSRKRRTESIIRTLLMAQWVLNLIAFLYYSLKFGIERSYRFEVATITINWLVLVIVGFMIGFHYRKRITSA